MTPDAGDESSDRRPTRTRRVQAASHGHCHFVQVQYNDVTMNAVELVAPRLDLVAL